MKEIKVEQYSLAINNKYDVSFIGMNENEFRALQNALEVHAVNARVYWPSDSNHSAVQALSDGLKEAKISYK